MRLLELCALSMTLDRSLFPSQTTLGARCLGSEVSGLETPVMVAVVTRSYTAEELRALARDLIPAQ